MSQDSFSSDSPGSIEIRPARLDDAKSLARIYNYYIAESTITFEEATLSPADMASRVEDIQAASLPWLVVEEKGGVLGYAYATQWRARSAYRFSVEVTVYLDPAQGRRGFGAKLYDRLLAELKACGVHVAIGGIALPNEASVALHERCGFHKVAHFEKVGFKSDRWIDVGYWQRIV